MANIQTERARCRSRCRRRLNEFSREGDVIRCEHGRIIYCYCLNGSPPVRWQYLNRILNPIRYRRAVRALSGADQ